MVLEVILVVLGVVLVVLHGAQRQCSEQMFGTDSVRNSVPSQLRLQEVPKRALSVLKGDHRALRADLIRDS